QRWQIYPFCWLFRPLLFQSTGALCCPKARPTDPPFPHHLPLRFPPGRVLSLLPFSSPTSPHPKPFLAHSSSSGGQCGPGMSQESSRVLWTTRHNQHPDPSVLLPLSHTALGSWGVTYPKSLRGISGSCVVIPCSLSFPDKVVADDGVVAIWYKDYNDQKTLVFHSAAQEVDALFRGRAQLLGDPSARNCTLQLQRVTVGDSGPYRFRFEIVNGDRWSAAQDVVIATSEEQTEGQTSTLECSTPYVCPPGDITLSWQGHDPQVSVVSGRVQMDTSGVGHYLTLTTSFSWRDHSKKLLCELSYDPPRNLQMKAFVESNEGTAVILLCTVESNPLSEITLLKEGLVVASSPATGGDLPWQSSSVSPSPNTLRLELQEASEEDEGEYECRAHSPLGSIHGSLPLRVQGESSFTAGSEGGQGLGTPEWSLWACHQGADTSLGRGAGGDGRDSDLPGRGCWPGDRVLVVQGRSVGAGGPRCAAPAASCPPLGCGRLRLRGGDGAAGPQGPPRRPQGAL
uniref:Sialic acid binding Ig like lectin 1 n=1 Tax=Strigops habroptila TaxID=2489341 RepID=A0A672UGJ3_STRHB